MYNNIYFQRKKNPAKLKERLYNRLSQKTVMLNLERKINKNAMLHIHVSSEHKPGRNKLWKYLSNLNLHRNVSGNAGLALYSKYIEK